MLQQRVQQAARGCLWCALRTQVRFLRCTMCCVGTGLGENQTQRCEALGFLAVSQLCIVGQLLSDAAPGAATGPMAILARTPPLEHCRPPYEPVRLSCNF